MTSAGTAPRCWPWPGAWELQATSVDRSVLDALDYVREFSVDGLRFVVPKRTINAGNRPGTVAWATVDREGHVAVFEDFGGTES